MDDRQELEQERYETALAALRECVLKGVSENSVLILAVDCGVDQRDIFKTLSEIAA